MARRARGVRGRRGASAAHQGGSRRGQGRAAGVCQICWHMHRSPVRFVHALGALYDALSAGAQAAQLELASSKATVAAMRQQQRTSSAAAAQVRLLLQSVHRRGHLLSTAWYFPGLQRSVSNKLPHAICNTNRCMCVAACFCMFCSGCWACAAMWSNRDAPSGLCLLQAEAVLEGQSRELASMAQSTEALRKEVTRLSPLEALTSDLQRECLRLHDTSDMCAGCPQSCDRSRLQVSG